MSRASSERDAAVDVMVTGLLANVFDEAEVHRMLVEALNRMTVREMESLVRDCTRYEDLSDVEVASM